PCVGALDRERDVRAARAVRIGGGRDAEPAPRGELERLLLGHAKRRAKDVHAQVQNRGSPKAATTKTDTMKMISHLPVVSVIAWTRGSSCMFPRAVSIQSRPSQTISATMASQSSLGVA